MPKRRIRKGGLINQSIPTPQAPTQAPTQAPAPQVKVPPNPSTIATTATAAATAAATDSSSSMFSSFTSMFDMSNMDTTRILMYGALAIVGVVLIFVLYSVLSSNKNDTSKKDDSTEGKED